MPIIVSPSRHGSVIRLSSIFRGGRFEATDRRPRHLPAGPAVPNREPEPPMACPVALDNSRQSVTISETSLLQARIDGPIRPEAWLAALAADRTRLTARPARQRRLARLYDRADRRAIGTAEPRLLANATLAHWLYVRAAGDQPYPWLRMASDYRHGLLVRAGLADADIAALPPGSRPWIARRILIAAGRAEDDADKAIAVAG